MVEGATPQQPQAFLLLTLFPHQYPSSDGRAPPALAYKPSQKGKPTNPSGCWDGTLNCRRSQTLRAPSSPPLSRKGSRRLQLMTLTSLSWAVAVVSMQALLGAARMSQMRMEVSAEQEANTWTGQSRRDPGGPPLHHGDRGPVVGLPFF